jgi:hypothetical protein
MHNEKTVGQLEIGMNIANQSHRPYSHLQASWLRLRLDAG